MLALILSLLGVGGIGAAAFIFPAFGKMLFGFLRAIPWYAYVVAAIIGLIAFLAISRGNWIDRAKGAEAQLAAICQATRQAAKNPKLDCDKTLAQIRELGTSLETTTNALNRQNSAVSKWKSEADRQQGLAAAAVKKAKPRADSALATASRLNASAAKAPANQCEPSEALKEAWQ